MGCCHVPKIILYSEWRERGEMNMTRGFAVSMRVADDCFGVILFPGVANVFRVGIV